MDKYEYNYDCYRQICRHCHISLGDKKMSLINVKQKQRFDCFHLNSSGLLPSISTLVFTLFI